MMTPLLHRFTPIQQAIEATNSHYDRGRRLLVAEFDAMLHVDFYASPFDDYWHDFLALLCQPDIASRVKRLYLNAPDEGANGTTCWDFQFFLKTDTPFPNLTHLSIQKYNGFNHNHPIVSDNGWSYEENGVLAKWLDRAPNLIHLTTPSAPNADFFKRDLHPLEILDLQAGYDTQNFILNLSESRCFPHLRRLEYRDYDETYIADYQKNCTPLAHFQQLFQSPLFDTIRSFMWFNPIFSDDELKQLKALRPELSFKVVRMGYNWIR